jgi:hypothetical protein
MSSALPGRRNGEEVDKRETISLYDHQLLRAKDLQIGNKRVERAANKTTEAFTARHAG